MSLSFISTKIRLFSSKILSKQSRQVITVKKSVFRLNPKNVRNQTIMTCACFNWVLLLLVIAVAILVVFVGAILYHFIRDIHGCQECSKRTPDLDTRVRDLKAFLNRVFPDEKHDA